MPGKVQPSTEVQNFLRKHKINQPTILLDPKGRPAKAVRFRMTTRKKK